ncbi:hypothetical protein [Haladaptatus sp. CMAA 1911]|uniref:hypothetical protein n=1 Tax=unclassified Haladaptatus TaxID=2622732 RepID=UPI003754833B
MSDGTTATERVFLTGQSEIGTAVVFRDAFEFVAIDSDPLFVDVVDEQVGTFLELASLEFVTGLCLAGDCLSMGLCPIVTENSRIL